MKPSHFAASVGILAAIASTATAGIVFGPVKGHAGESIRLVTNSETPGGTIQRSTSGKNSSGTISIDRERELVWTFRNPAPDGTRRGMVRVKEIVTDTVVKIDGKQEKTNDISPLTGKMFSMSKAPKGDWKFELDGSVPLTRVQKEIDELTVYLKRDWFPTRELNVGDTWEFDPAWVKMIIEKDLSKAQTIGTMRLRQLRSSIMGKTAIIDVTVRSTGADFKSDGSESSASIELNGQITVNLNTMLDEKLELNGTVNSSSRKGGESTTVKLPVRLTATKSFVKGGLMP